MYKTCVFDLDGTLADTLESIAYFANLTLRHFGLPEIPREEYKRMVGNGARALVRRMLSFAGGDENDAEKVLRYYKRVYDDNFLYKTRPYDGISELVAGLKARGMRLAVLSNKPHETTVKVVNALFGEGFFDVCRGLVDGAPAKPDAAALDAVLEETNTAADECVYVGDTMVDIETGRNAGVFTIGVLWGFRDIAELRAAGAGLIVASPDEILKFLA